MSLYTTIRWLGESKGGFLYATSAYIAVCNPCACKSFHPEIIGAITQDFPTLSWIWLLTCSPANPRNPLSKEDYRYIWCRPCFLKHWFCPSPLLVLLTCGKVSVHEIRKVHTSHFLLGLTIYHTWWPPWLLTRYHQFLLLVPWKYNPRQFPMISLSMSSRLLCELSGRDLFCGQMQFCPKRTINAQYKSSQVNLSCTI